MWFALGLVTLAGAAVASGYRRLHAAELESSGNGFRYKFDYDKAKALQRVRVSVTAPPKVSFECKRESWFDELCKRWKLVREPQSGDPRFDRWVYVLSDDPVFRNALAGSLAKPMVELFVNHDPATASYKLQRLVCRDGRLLADFKVEGEEDDFRARAFASRTAVAMKDIASTIPKAMGTRRFFDPLFFRSVLILGASTGLAITGALQMARVLWSTNAWIHEADLARLWMFTFAFAGALLLAMIIATIAMLGRTARLHLVLVEVCLFGAFGAIATCFAELRDAVMEFDSSTPMRVETMVTRKHISRGRRHTTYYVDLADWRSPGERVSLDVSYSDYNALTVYGKASIVEHSGAMGIRWLDDLRAE